MDAKQYKASRLKSQNAKMVNIFCGNASLRCGDCQGVPEQGTAQLKFNSDMSPLKYAGLVLVWIDMQYMHTVHQGVLNSHFEGL